MSYFQSIRNISKEEIFILTKTVMIQVKITLAKMRLKFMLDKSKLVTVNKRNIQMQNLLQTIKFIKTPNNPHHLK